MTCHVLRTVDPLSVTLRGMGTHLFKGRSVQTDRVPHSTPTFKGSKAHTPRPHAGGVILGSDKAIWAWITGGTAGARVGPSIGANIALRCTRLT